MERLLNNFIKEKQIAIALISPRDESTRFRDLPLFLMRGKKRTNSDIECDVDRKTRINFKA
jgi:hypothetical protein